MAAEPAGETLPELRRNELLRQVDWRFLLRGGEAPRTAEPGGRSEAIGLISSGEPVEPGSADLAVIGFPSGGSLRSARSALAPGGEVVCAWRLPRLAGPRRARRRLVAAGFDDVRVYWAGPLPQHPPQFWLPLDSGAATQHLLSLRPPRSRAQAALQWAWRLVARAGLLAPLYAIAQVAEEPDDRSAALLLLTGGRRSINKVVGLAFEEGGGKPVEAVKFARVQEAEAGLEHEAEVLGLLGRERPELDGIPRLRGRLRRGGMLGVAESPIEGESMLGALNQATFGELAHRVTGLLVDLAGSDPPISEASWRDRLVDEPLKRFERCFGPALKPGVAARARAALDGLGDLPNVCEHRDCSPWNVIVGAAGALALLDWESAEPRGLPGLDLFYFLANSAFVLDGALEKGSTRESYSRMLDPDSLYGAVAAEATEEYSAALGIGAETCRQLRLLCWIVHSGSDFRHLELDIAGVPSPESLRGAMFLGLIEEELDRDQLR
jgi:hypothetical protein